MYIATVAIFVIGLTRLANSEFNAPSFIELVNDYCQSRGISGQELSTQQLMNIVDEKLDIGKFLIKADTRCLRHEFRVSIQAKCVVSRFQPFFVF